MRAGIGPRATRFTARRSPICRDQHLISGSACPHVDGAWLPAVSAGTAQALQQDEGDARNRVLPHSLLPERRTTMDKQLRRSPCLATPGDRPSIEDEGRHRDRR